MKQHLEKLEEQAEQDLLGEVISEEEYQREMKSIDEELREIEREEEPHFR